MREKDIMTIPQFCERYAVPTHLVRWRVRDDYVQIEKDPKTGENKRPLRFDEREMLFILAFHGIIPMRKCARPRAGLLPRKNAKRAPKKKHPRKKRLIDRVVQPADA